jgi:hypothetical protein
LGRTLEAFGIRRVTQSLPKNACNILVFEHADESVGAKQVNVPNCHGAILDVRLRWVFQPYALRENMAEGVTLRLLRRQLLGIDSRLDLGVVQCELVERTSPQTIRTRVAHVP